jgi:hypothetical protein
MPIPVIPNFWTWKTPITAAKSVLVFRPYYGPVQTRTFGIGELQHAWELSNDDSSYADFNTIKTFWNTNYPGIDFYLYDPQLNETRLYQIDSDFAESYNHQDSFSWGFRIRETFPYTKLVGPPP